MSAQANFMRIRVPHPSALPAAESSEETPEKVSEAVLWDSSSSGTVELLCTVRALLKKMKQRVFVGDFVRVINIDWTSSQGLVADVVDRRSELATPPVANIDQVLLVFSLDKPAWDGKMATRFLVSAEASGLPVTVLLNKADLVAEAERQAAIAEVQGWGYPAICVSASTGLGLDALADCLARKVSVTAGPSGVGKSSLINSVNAALALPTESAAGNEGPETQAVGEVSQIGRGRHTTRNVSLLPVAGGLLADTPGFNQPALEGMQPQDLPACFPEIRDRLGTCKFSDCQHLEDDGCAVRDGWGRHLWYAELRLELEAAAAVARDRAVAKKKREGTVKYKSRGLAKRREVLLDPKRHRNVSRRQRKQDVMDLLAEVEQDSDEEAS